MRDELALVARVIMMMKEREERGDERGRIAVKERKEERGEGEETRENENNGEDEY